MSCKRLYYNEPYLTNFRARVTETGAVGGAPARPWVKLDETAFYPTSGGQPNDTGSIAGVRVLDVVEQGDDILHVLEDTEAARTLSASMNVECQIDWQRRFDFMQQHLGQHILSSAFEKVVDADTIGFHLTEHSLTVDLNAPSLTEEQVAAVEDMANSIVWRNLVVRIEWPSPGDLLAMPLRKPPTRSEGIRVIVVDGFDWSACGGTHPTKTGEVGLIKVLSWEKTKGGTRVAFVSGGRALADYRDKHRSVKAISSMLSVPVTEVEASAKRLAEQAQSQWKRVEIMSKQLLEYEVAAIVASGERVVSRYYPAREVQELRNFVSSVVANPGRVAIAGATAPSPQVIVARSEDLNVDARKLIEAAKSVLGGRGGGNPKLAQAGGPDGSLVESAVAAVVDMAKAAMEESGSQ